MSRNSVLHTLPLTAATALTSIVAFLAWGAFFERGGDLLVPLAGGVLLISLVGLLARLAHLPAMLVAGLQLLVVFLVANVAWGTSPWPTPESLTQVVHRIDASVDALTRWAPPVPAHADAAVVAPLLGALVLHLLVDLFALGLRRVPLAGLPLLAIQTVPISVHEAGVHWLLFVATAGGFLLMLCIQEGMRIGGWGRVFGSPRDNDMFRAFNGVDPGRHPVLIGSVAVLCALVASLAVPTFQLNPFPGEGDGGNDNEVRITNPIADLYRDLDRGEDIPLLRIVTEGIRPTYLRISALTQYSGVTWSPGDRDLPAANAATGRVPSPAGLAPSVPREERAMAVQVEEAFSSLWLPTPLTVSEVRAGDDWRFDRTVMDFHSAEDDIDTSGISYELVESRPAIEREALADAPSASGKVALDYTRLPDDLPPIVGDLAAQLTGGLDSDYERAVALQEWFRDPDNFTYSLETDEGAVVGNGSGALERFLSEEGRVGYCEQFAASMALMARSLGIPARVSVGFLRPDHIGTNTYEFSSHDLHAWPELWFEGHGWVLFEPTPQDRAALVPAYTTGGDDSEVEPNQPTEEPTTTAPSAQPSEQPTRAPEEPAPAATPPDAGDDGRDWRWLWVLPGLALLLLVPLVPGWVRRQRTRRRLADGDLETAWLELRDVALDLGRDWPDDRSPRATGRAVTQWLGAVPPAPRVERPATGPWENPEATHALEALVGLLEEKRYAADAPAPDAERVGTLVRIGTDALHAGATPRVRRRARWWPRSVLGRSARR